LNYCPVNLKEIISTISRKHALRTETVATHAPRNRSKQFYYLMTSTILPEPIVRPPSRIAKR